MNSNPEYNFSLPIRREVKAFGASLQGKGYKSDTIRQKCNYAGLYLAWLQAERMSPDQVRYNDLLAFVDHLRLGGRSPRCVNTVLLAVRNYYQWLMKTRRATVNPALNLRLRGVRRRVPAGILSYETLEKLYADYPVTGLRTARNRVILGLIVYQGLTCGELHRLTVHHIKLREGKIQVPGDGRSHHRVLELKSFQVIELHEYLTQVRPAILRQADTPKPSGRVACKTWIQDPDRSFASVNGSGNLKNSLHHLFCFLKKMNPEVKTPGQLRQSVIAWWLKNHNLRQVQYMAGHRWVSSTERYRLDNLEGLQAELDKYHPLG
jgi:integrase/recombinase XerD